MVSFKSDHMRFFNGRSYVQIPMTHLWITKCVQCIISTFRLVVKENIASFILNHGNIIHYSCKTYSYVLDDRFGPVIKSLLISISHGNVE